MLSAISLVGLVLFNGFWRFTLNHFLLALSALGLLLLRHLPLPVGWRRLLNEVVLLVVSLLLVFRLALVRVENFSCFLILFLIRLLVIRITQVILIFLLMLILLLVIEGYGLFQVIDLVLQLVFPHALLQRSPSFDILIVQAFVRTKSVSCSLLVVLLLLRWIVIIVSIVVIVGVRWLIVGVLALGLSQLLLHLADLGFQLGVADLIDVQVIFLLLIMGRPLVLREVSGVVLYLQLVGLQSASKIFAFLLLQVLSLFHFKYLTIINLNYLINVKVLHQ